MYSTVYLVCNAPSSLHAPSLLPRRHAMLVRLSTPSTYIMAKHSHQHREGAKEKLLTQSPNSIALSSSCVLPSFPPYLVPFSLRQTPIGQSLSASFSFFSFPHTFTTFYLLFYLFFPQLSFNLVVLIWPHFLFHLLPSPPISTNSQRVPLTSSSLSNSLSSGSFALSSHSPSSPMRRSCAVGLSGRVNSEPRTAGLSFFFPFLAGYFRQHQKTRT